MITSQASNPMTIAHSRTNMNRKNVTLVEETLFQNDWLLQFTKHLQSTLNVEQLLEVFTNDTLDEIPYDGLIFESASDALIVKIHNEAAPHKCMYDLLLSEKLLGKITFLRKSRFTEADTLKLELLVSHLLYPLRNALLYREALLVAAKDPLTGAFNRVALDNTLMREIQLSRRYNNPLAMMMLDLDHFKAVNDQYGHIAGDCVLRSFVEKVAHQMRLSDMLFRYGGEEFIILLNNTGKNGALLLADRIRSAVEEMIINCDGVHLNVTVSIGVSILEAQDDETGFIHRADTALYQAKENGRNCVKLI